MATLLDYLELNKDKTFDELPFNEVDAAILAQFTYLNVDLFISDDKFYPLSYFIIDIEKLTNPTLFVKNNKIFYSRILSGLRYKDFYIGELSIYNDETTQTRFCAMTFKHNDTYFISYRGTDLTILGWVEDLNMAIYDEIPSQKLSREYCEKIISKYEGKYYLIGHSKGGNMACYAATFVKEEFQDKIIKVYDFDGPGFNRDITKSTHFLKISDKLIRIMPQSDYFGVLLNGNSNYLVVKSKSHGILQHDIMSWEVKDNVFIYVSKIKHSSSVLGKSTLIWLNSMTYEQKIDFVSIIYNIFNEAGINSVNDFKKNAFKASNALIKAYSKEDKETKKMIIYTFRRLINLYIKTMFTSESNPVLKFSKKKRINIDKTKEII